MQIHDDDDVIDQPNTTPMNDILLVVLVIIIVTISPPNKGHKITLPSSSSSVSLSAAKTRSITVTKDDTIFYDTVPVSMGELEQRLTQEKASTPDVQVVIKGDAQTPYQNVEDVLDLVKRLGIPNVGLATRPRGQA